MKAMKSLNLLLALMLALALAGCNGGGSDHYVPPEEPKVDPTGSWIWSWDWEPPTSDEYGNYVESVEEGEIPEMLRDQCFVDFLADQGVGIDDITAVWTTSAVPYEKKLGSDCWNAPPADKWVYVMKLENGDFLLMDLIDDGEDFWGILAYVGDYSQLEDSGNVDFGSVPAVEGEPEVFCYVNPILLRLERGDVFTPNMCE